MFNNLVAIITPKNIYTNKINFVGIITSSQINVEIFLSKDVGSTELCPNCNITYMLYIMVYAFNNAKHLYLVKGNYNNETTRVIDHWLINNTTFCTVLSI